ncbi:LysR substrate-binding domain-containing protein [Serratia marcescens]|nr:LysR substrate-binding domain-containing protein [Serratia marcescens]
METLTQDIRDYIQHCPNANISVQREALNGTWDALKNNRADLIIAIGQIPDSVQAKTLMLGKLNFVLCVSPSHPFAAQKKAGVQEAALERHRGCDRRQQP